MRGWIYVFSEPAMPELVKVGFSMSDPAERARELFTTGVPQPYFVEYDALVLNPQPLESRAHRELDRFRETQSREWFRCSAGKAITTVRTLGVNEILLEECYGDDPNVEAAKAHRPVVHYIVVKNALI